MATPRKSNVGKRILFIGLACLLVLIGSFGVASALVPRSSFSSNISISTVHQADLVNPVPGNIIPFVIDCPPGSLISNAGYDYSGPYVATVTSNARVDSDTWEIDIRFTANGSPPPNGLGAIGIAGVCVTV